MKNIFLDYPDFIDRDPRKNRGAFVGSFRPTAKCQFIRHNTPMDPAGLKGLSVLDLGCCIGASGAWVLHHGASSYVGVEIEQRYATVAKENLEKYFPSHNWNILNQSLDDFFQTNQTQFDIVIAFGIIFNSVELEKLLDNLSQVTKNRLIIEAPNPGHINCLKSLDRDNPNLLKQYDINIDKLAITELTDFVMTYRQCATSRPTVPFVEVMLNSNGLEFETNFTDDLKQLLPQEYSGRYCVSFIKQESTTKIQSYADHYKNDPEYQPEEWKFGARISKEFVDHARHHIPGYDRIIKKTIDICKLLLTPFSNQHRIIDVGCATGETIKHLNLAGFHNLLGVDASADMLDEARNNKIDSMSYLVHQDTFPIDLGPYHAVISNWTLHFIKDKQSYLTDIYNSLLPGGLLIITDKTYNDGSALTLYHDFKTTQGLSDKEIYDKHASVQSVMFIDPPEWYLGTLKDIGFSDVSIIDAEYCFTTFLAIKK
jgi:SAM-dependent methyltransferase